MGHLTALKDLRQKGFVIPGSDGTVNPSEHIRRQRRSSGGRREPEAKAISTSPRHRRAYEGALRHLQDWLAGRSLDDATLAEYLAARFEAGRVEHSGAD